MLRTDNHFHLKCRKSGLWNWFRHISLTSFISVLFQGPADDVTKPFPVPSLPNGTSKPRRPLLKFEK